MRREPRQVELSPGTGNSPADYRGDPTGIRAHLPKRRPAITIVNPTKTSNDGAGSGAAETFNVPLPPTEKVVVPTKPEPDA